MNDKKLLKAGLIGAAISCVFCLTPVLVVAFGAVGLSAWVGGLDYILFPALGLFLAMIIYALVQRRKQTSEAK
ncbi:MAG: mercury resistance system transport protein MerF [Rhodospirillales bacterium]|nr:mercury resistance system transport protein MerF [Rhodospirillales bacterium]